MIDFEEFQKKMGREEFDELQNMTKEVLQKLTVLSTKVSLKSGQVQGKVPAPMDVVFAWNMMLLQHIHQLIDMSIKVQSGALESTYSKHFKNGGEKGDR